MAYVSLDRNGDRIEHGWLYDTSVPILYKITFKYNYDNTANLSLGTLKTTQNCG